MNSTVLVTSEVDAAGRVLLSLETEAGRREASFHSNDIRLAASNEASIAASFLPAMLLGSDPVADGPVSGYPYLRPVEIRGAVPVLREANERGRVGVLFAAGVDSFYTLMQRLDEVTDLIFIRGFEYPVEEQDLLDRMAAPVHTAAARLGLRVIELGTNLRPFLRGHGLRWGLHGGGVTKATLGHLLFPEFKRLYWGAGCTYAELFPWGSHPVLDPMWGSEAMEFIHFGMEADRIEKLRSLSQHDWLLKSLRCCNERPATALNCGRCEKCMRTMLNLMVVGALERCPTFEVGLDPRRLAAIRLHTGHTRALTRQNLAALEQGGHPRALIRALQTALRRSQRESALRELMQSTFPWIYETLSKVRGLTRRAKPSAAGGWRAA